MLDCAFVASAAPQGWSLGRWAQVNAMIWEEVKLDGRSTYQYMDCGASGTPGSKSVKLKGIFDGKPALIVITDTSIQVFSEGEHLGEYLGAWDNAEPAAPPAPSQFARPQVQRSNSGGSLSKASAASKTTTTSTAKGRPKKATGCDRSPEMVEKLFQAVKAGDEFAVRRFLNQPVDPDSICPSEGTTPLIAATQKGSRAIVELLVEAGADVNKDVDGQTSLIVAYQKGRKDVLRVLFGAVIGTLESTFKGDGAEADQSLSTLREEEEFDDRKCLYELREVTAKLSNMNKKQWSGALGTHVEAPPLDIPEDSDRMREECVRETMKSLLSASR